MFLIIFYLLINNVFSLSQIKFREFISLKTKKNDILPILSTIEKSCKCINKLIKSNINNDYTFTMNIHNEKQSSIDILSNNIIKDSLLKLKCVDSIISEEENNVCYNLLNGKYIVAIDPLDGSSNVKSNLPTGTIFGIYNKENKELISAGYCLYSSSVVLVVSCNNTVDMFIYDDKTNHFYLSKINIRIPDNNIYSFNLENQKINNFISNNKNSFRYTGALVADAHNILLNGGLFGYPKSLKHENGKLRLLYECKPISKIIVDAGGEATDGNNNILDLKFGNIHDKSPFFFGSSYQVKKIKYYLN
jgi:fructose-1,6-bisphosphatase I